MSRGKVAFIEDVCEILDSQRIPITASERKAGIYPYYGANGVQDYVHNYIFDDELVLVAEDGGNFGSKERPIAYRISGKCWVNNHAHVLKPKNMVDVDYLCYSLMFYDVTDIINGATRQKLNQAALRKIKIPLPPLAEQQKIADELDKISGLIAKRKNQIEKLDLLVKAKFVEMFGDPVTNPMGWDKVNLDKYYKVTSSKRVYQNELTTTGIPFYKISDLIDKMENLPCKNSVFISEALYQDYEKLELTPKENDILITSRGTLGKCYIVKNDDRFYFQDGMISWLKEKNNEIDRTFFVFLFGTSDIKKQIASDSTGATVNYLSIDKIRKLSLLSPPLTLQTQFADFVQKTEQTKTTMQKSLAGLETLYKARMQEYFE